MNAFAPAALTISGIDAGIVLIYLAAITWMGVWIGRGSKSVGDYLLGDGKLPWWAVLGSIVATETSTASESAATLASYAKFFLRELRAVYGW